MWPYKPLSQEEIRKLFPKLIAMQQELIDMGVDIRFRIYPREIERVFGKPQTKKTA